MNTTLELPLTNAPRPPARPPVRRPLERGDYICIVCRTNASPAGYAPLPEIHTAWFRRGVNGFEIRVHLRVRVDLEPEIYAVRIENVATGAVHHALLDRRGESSAWHEADVSPDGLLVARPAEFRKARH